LYTLNEIFKTIYRYNYKDILDKFSISITNYFVFCHIVSLIVVYEGHF